MTNESDGRWALLSNHGHILLYVAEHPDATISEVSDAVGLTERATARILSDLRQAGFIGATRVGRRNTYHVDPLRPLRPQITERELRVGDLLSGLLSRPLRARTLGERSGLRSGSRNRIERTPAKSRRTRGATP